MKVLRGRQQNDIQSEGLAKLLKGHFPVHIDVGTGSGRLMLKSARKSPNGFFIGMDPCADSMCENSLKAMKHKKKTKHNNLLFVIASIESPPEELNGIADIITIILPWGSLRNGIVKADPPVLGNLRMLGKPDSVLEIIVGYEERTESREMEKHLLPVLSRGYFTSLSPEYRKAGIKIRSVEVISNGDLKPMESDWAKKLAYGRPRTMYRLDCVFI